MGSVWVTVSANTWTSSPKAVDAERVEAGLRGFIARKANARRVSIQNLVRLSGGASRETWSFDAEMETGSGVQRERLIFRCDPIPGVPSMPGRELEFHLIRAAMERGAVVPEPCWDGDETFDVKFFVMKQVPGEALGARLIRGAQYERARAVLPQQLAESLARIHTITKEEYPELARLPGPDPGVSPALNEVRRYEEIFRATAPNAHPVFELVFRWLYINMPPVEEVRFVHGDFRLGNFLFDEAGLTGIVDWELAHWGDPMEDLGWICVRSWRFGGEKPVAGICDRDEFFRLYEAAGGLPVDPERVRFWEVFGNLRWGIITITQANTYLSGRSKSVELASIGRRTAETEWELLRLIEGAR